MEFKVGEVVLLESNIRGDTQKGYCYIYKIEKDIVYYTFVNLKTGAKGNSQHSDYTLLDHLVKKLDYRSGNKIKILYGL